MRNPVWNCYSTALAAIVHTTSIHFQISPAKIVVMLSSESLWGFTTTALTAWSNHRIKRMKINLLTSFFVGALFCLVGTGLSDAVSELTKLCIYAGTALSVTLIWRRWARNTLVNRNQRRDLWASKKSEKSES